MSEKMTTMRRAKHPGSARVFDFLIAYIQREQYPPTLREICNGCQIASVSTARHHLRVLQEWRVIEVKDGSPRAIRILRRKRKRS